MQTVPVKHWFATRRVLFTSAFYRYLLVPYSISHSISHDRPVFSIAPRRHIRLSFIIRGMLYLFLCPSKGCLSFYDTNRTHALSQLSSPWPCRSLQWFSYSLHLPPQGYIHLGFILFNPPILSVYLQYCKAVLPEHALSYHSPHYSF